MLIIALALALIGLAALVFAVVTSNELVAWVCIVASVIGVVLLIIDALRERRAQAAEADDDGEADEADDDADEGEADDYVDYPEEEEVADEGPDEDEADDEASDAAEDTTEAK